MQPLGDSPGERIRLVKASVLVVAHLGRRGRTQLHTAPRSCRLGNAATGASLNICTVQNANTLHQGTRSIAKAWQG